MDPTLPSVFTQQFNMPQPQQGMFGAAAPNKTMSIIAAMLNGFTAGMPGPGHEAGLQGLQALQQGIAARRQTALEEQIYEHRQDLEMQRQMTMLPLEAQLKLMYPDGDFAQSLYASGLRPGTPGWTQAMQTRTQNELDPAVVTPQGMMLRSQITGALQPPPAPVGKLTPITDGGPTPPASGGFLGSGGFSDVGPYKRY
jgi:hypothetical protein